jgi:general secretion pathway protein G
MNMHRDRNRRARAGFSLIELTLVLAIIAMLATFAAFNMAGVGERARRKATMSNIQTIRTAINMYHAAYNGQYPPSLDALMTGAMPFLDPDKGINDGWGRPFVYDPQRAGDKPYSLLSLGGDGQFGTPDDLNIWALPPE